MISLVFPDVNVWLALAHEIHLHHYVVMVKLFTYRLEWIDIWTIDLLIRH